MTAPHRIGQIPRIGRYDIDPQGSTVTFRGRHLFGLAPVRGTFAVRHGVLDIVDPVAESRVEVDIDAASFHTGSRRRDTDVRSARFLDTDRYPSMTFTSRRLDRSGSAWTLAGVLTVRGSPVRSAWSSCPSSGPPPRPEGRVRSWRARPPVSTGPSSP